MRACIASLTIPWSYRPCGVNALALVTKVVNRVPLYNPLRYR
jgi:hypothetical protein